MCLVLGIVYGHLYFNFQSLVEIPLSILIGHFWWDQELNVNVVGGSDVPELKFDQPSAVPDSKSSARSTELNLTGLRNL
jgi:hypothetical protein